MPGPVGTSVVSCSLFEPWNKQGQDPGGQASSSLLRSSGNVCTTVGGWTLFLTHGDTSSLAHITRLYIWQLWCQLICCTEANRGWHSSNGSDACAAGDMQRLLVVLAAVLLVGAAAAPVEYNILQDLSNTCQANLAASRAVETACGSGRYQSTINLNLLNTGGLQNVCWRQHLFAASKASQPCLSVCGMHELGIGRWCNPRSCSPQRSCSALHAASLTHCNLKSPCRSPRPQHL